MEYYDETKPFSDQLKAARKAAGLSQAAMARAMNVSRRNIEDWEAGKSSPPQWSAELLLKELNLRRVKMNKDELQIKLKEKYGIANEAAKKIDVFVVCRGEWVYNSKFLTDEELDRISWIVADLNEIKGYHVTEIEYFTVKDEAIAFLEEYHKLSDVIPCIDENGNKTVKISEYYLAVEQWWWDFKKNEYVPFAVWHKYLFSKTPKTEALSNMPVVYFDVTEPFSDQLKAAREKFGLTIEETAKAVKIADTVLEKWENGDNRPPSWQAELVLEKLNNSQKK